MLVNTSSTGGFLLQTMLYFANYTDHSQNNTLEDFYHLPAGAETDKHKPQCYGVYGCFSIEYPWTTETRLVSLYPESPLRINPRYPVFHNDARMIPAFLDLNDPEATRQAGINPRGNIFMISHGYLESGDRPWIQEMVNALLDADKKQTASVIIIDWGGGSSPPYSQAVANIRLVGAITAHIIHMIYEELQLENLNKVHIIGHSLGAHLCGYTGYTLQKDFGLILGRITGLDPAEPLFSETDPIVRLDRTDAIFVDVIHTDALPFSSGGLGMRMPLGHVDFYPNGGYNNPGCDVRMQDYIEQEKGSLFRGIQQFLSCNHIRSHQFMTESLRTKCPFAGITCESYDDFRHGNCFQCNQNGHQCIHFGLNSINSYQHLISSGKIVDVLGPVRVYLMTSNSSPFCRTHYKITLRMSSSEESSVHGGEIGIMSLILHSHFDERNRTMQTEKMQFSQDPVYYEPGYNYTAVMPGRDVGTPEQAILSWEYKSNPLNPLTWRILATPRVYIDSIMVESLEYNSKLMLCSMYKEPVAADSGVLFRNEYCFTSR